MIRWFGKSRGTHFSMTHAAEEAFVIVVQLFQLRIQLKMFSTESTEGLPKTPQPFIPLANVLVMRRSNFCYNWRLTSKELLWRLRLLKRALWKSQFRKLSRSAAYACQSSCRRCRFTVVSFNFDMAVSNRIIVSLTMVNIEESYLVMVRSISTDLCWGEPSASPTPSLE